MLDWFNTINALAQLLILCALGCLGGAALLLFGHWIASTPIRPHRDPQWFRDQHTSMRRERTRQMQKGRVN